MTNPPPADKTGQSYLKSIGLCSTVLVIEYCVLVIICNLVLVICDFIFGCQMRFCAKNLLTPSNSDPLS